MYLQQSSRLVERRVTYQLQQPGLWQKGTVACSMLISASMYILIARTLGPQTFGGYVFVQWLATVAVPAIGAGVSALSSCQLADIQSRESPQRAAGIFYFLWYCQYRRILCYSLLYLLLAFPLAQIFHALAPIQLLLASLSVLPLFLSSVVGTTLRGLRRSDLLALLHLFGSLVTILLVIFATQVDGQKVEAFLIAVALASTMTLILAVICVIQLLPLSMALPPGFFLKEKLVRSLHTSWHRFALDVIVWQRSELLLLACWHNSSDLGCYAISAMLSNAIMHAAPLIFTQWLAPLLTRLTPAYRYHNHYDAFIKTSCSILFLSIAICALTVLIMPTLIVYTLGPTYLPMMNPLRVLLIASVFGSSATVSLTHLLQKETSSIRLRLETVTALLKIILLIPCISYWGLIGAAIISAATQIASTFFAIFFCQQLLRLQGTNNTKGTHT